MRHFRHISANSCRRGCSIIEHLSGPGLSAWEAAFPPGAWAAGEDYLLGERVLDLRRDRGTLAGRVRGTHGDYWVRLGLGLPAVSACDCTRPRCRHAAAVIQAYHARRLPVVDVARLVNAFLAHPSRAPLSAAAMGADLVSAMDLPPEDVADIWALPDDRRLLALDAALRFATDRLPLLLRAMREAASDAAMQALLAAALTEHRPAPAECAPLLRAAPEPLAELVADLRPPDISHPLVLSALWQAAADNDLPSLARLAPHAVSLAPVAAYHALEDLLPALRGALPAYLDAARAAGRLKRAVIRLLTAADQMSADEAASIESAVAASGELPKALQVRVRLRSAARAGGAPQILAARRAAVAQDLWPELRAVTLTRIRQRPDGAILETQLLLAEDNIEEALQVADRCRSSPLPQRLVAEALRGADPARARVHELRAQAIAEQLAKPPAGSQGRFGHKGGRNARPRR